MTPYTRAQKQYLESMSFEDRDWPGHVYPWILSACTEKQETIALSFMLRPKDFRKSHDLSYAEFITAIHQTTHLLQGLGMKPEDKLAIVLPQIPEFWMALWGGILTTQVIVLDPMLPEADLQSLLQAAAPKVLLTLGPYPGYELWEKIEGVREAIPSLTTVLQVDLNAYLGRMKRWQARRILRSRGKAEPIAHQKIGDFNASRQKLSGDLAPNMQFPDSHQAILWMAEGEQLLGYTPHQLCAWTWAIQQALPFAESGRSALWAEGSYSWSACVLDGLFPLLGGQRILSVGPRGVHGEGIQDLLPEISAYFQLTSMRIGVGSLMSMGHLAGERLPEHWIVDHGWMPASVIRTGSSRAYWQLYRADLGILLGLTRIESEEALYNRILPVPLPYLDTNMLAKEDKNMLDLGGPLLPVSPKTAVHAEVERRSADQWKDLGNQEHQIEVQGLTFSVLEVEAELNAHPAVAASVVIGKQDAEKGHIPIAYIQLRPGDQTGPKEIYDKVKEKLPDERMVPLGFRIVDLLPCTSNGALNRTLLSAQENAS